MNIHLGRFSLATTMGCFRWTPKRERFIGLATFWYWFNLVFVKWDKHTPQGEK